MRDTNLIKPGWILTLPTGRDRVGEADPAPATPRTGDFAPQDRRGAGRPSTKPSDFHQSYRTPVARPRRQRMANRRTMRTTTTSLCHSY